MPPATITAIAFLLTSAVEAGLTITEVLQEVQRTGVVPVEEWNRFKREFEDAEKFWAGAVAAKEAEEVSPRFPEAPTAPTPPTET